MSSLTPEAFNDLRDELRADIADIRTVVDTTLKRVKVDEGVMFTSAGTDVRLKQDSSDPSKLAVIEDPLVQETAASDSVIKLIGRKTLDASTSSVTEVVLNTITVPGGTMGPNGLIIIYSKWRGDTLSVIKRARIYFGGFIVQNQELQTQNNLDMFFLPLFIWNKNDTQAQRGSIKFGTQHVRASDPIVNLTLDTSVDQDIDFRGLVDNASATLTLQSAFVLAIHGE